MNKCSNNDERFSFHVVFFVFRDKVGVVDGVVGVDGVDVLFISINLSVE